MAATIAPTQALPNCASGHVFHQAKARLVQKAGARTTREIASKSVVLEVVHDTLVEEGYNTLAVGLVDSCSRHGASGRFVADDLQTSKSSVPAGTSSRRPLTWDMATSLRSASRRLPSRVRPADRFIGVPSELGPSLRELRSAWLSPFGAEEVCVCVCGAAAALGPLWETSNSRGGSSACFYFPRRPFVIILGDAETGWTLFRRVYFGAARSVLVRVSVSLTPRPAVLTAILGDG